VSVLRFSLPPFSANLTSFDAMGLLGKITELIRGRRQQRAEKSRRAYLLSLYMGEANGIEGPDRAFRPNRERQHSRGAKRQDHT
jgi:hypothetical protein